MGLLSFLFGGSSRQPAPPISRFQPGQMWAITPHANHPNARLTILRVEDGGKLGTIVHIALSGISYGDDQTEVSHLPFSEAAIERSVTTLVRESGPVPDFADGYRHWREAFDAGKGGIFTCTAAEVIDVVTRAAEVRDQPQE